MTDKKLLAVEKINARLKARLAKVLSFEEGKARRDARIREAMDKTIPPVPNDEK